MKFSAIITAGGTSSRFGQNNKLLEKVHLKEVIVHTVDAFLNVPEISEIVICANFSIIKILNELFKDYDKVKVIQGGKTRQESVFNGLTHLQATHLPPDYVLIHDGARPMITPEIINNAIVLVQEKKALTVATKTTDTIKQVDKDLKIIKTIDRDPLWNTQTPQAFEYKLILDAHEKLQGLDFSDDAGMMEYLGQDVYILEGNYINIKITTQSDIELAKIFLDK